MVSVLSHQEGLRAGMSGHNFVETFASAVQRRSIRQLARTLVEHVTKDFTATRVLAVKAAIHDSALWLRMPTADNKGSSLKSRYGCNGMHWARSFAMLVCDWFESPNILFTPSLWAEMIRSQANYAKTQVAMNTFGVASYACANDLLREFGFLDWALFVCLCESRQAFQAGQDDGKAFLRVLRRILRQPDAWRPVIVAETQTIVSEGAEAEACFATRLVRAVKKRMDAAGPDAAPVT